MEVGLPDMCRTGTRPFPRAPIAEITHQSARRNEQRRNQRQQTGPSSLSKPEKLRHEPSDSRKNQREARRRDQNA